LLGREVGSERDGGCMQEFAVALYKIALEERRSGL